jgi:hypothetical protein
MKNKWLNWINKPVTLALLLLLLDLAWLLGLHIGHWLLSPPDGMVPTKDPFEIINPAVQLWNFVHLPIRSLIEPIVFSIVTSHPLYPSSLMFYFYQIICLQQSLIIGYALGLLINFPSQGLNRRL